MLPADIGQIHLRYISICVYDLWYVPIFTVFFKAAKNTWTSDLKFKRKFKKKTPVRFAASITYFYNKNLITTFTLCYK